MELDLLSQLYASLTFGFQNRSQLTYVSWTTFLSVMGFLRSQVNSREEMDGRTDGRTDRQRRN